MGIFEELTKTEWLLGGIAVILLLLLIAVLAVLHEQRHTTWMARFDSDVDRALERIGKATQHYAEVAAAVAYLDQVQGKPELIAKLGEYSRQAVAACLLQRMAILSETIKAVQQRLQYSEDMLAQGYTSHRDKAATCRKQLAQLQADQQALQQLAEELSAPHLRAV